MEHRQNEPMEPQMITDPAIHEDHVWVRGADGQMHEVEVGEDAEDA